MKLLKTRNKKKHSAEGPCSNRSAKMKYSLLFPVAALFFWGLLIVSQNLESIARSLSDAVNDAVATIPGNNGVEGKTSDSTSLVSAATGQRFAGNKVRKFQGSRRTKTRNKNSKEDVASLQPFLADHQALYQKCDKWAVVTTIYGPTNATKLVGDNPEMREWCMVVVADTKTPETYMTDAGWDMGRNGKVVFLSVAEQLKLAKQVPFVKQTPFRSFARKNIGYLYAIWMGAKVIFDFDDDNEVTTKIATNDNALWSGTELLLQFTDGVNDAMVKHVSLPINYEGRAFNPFPMMGATVGDAWPRGLPLSLINEKACRGAPGPLLLKEVKRGNVAVIQSLADLDPDVDSIFRLSRPLPFEFDKSKSTAFTVEVPRNHYSPYNAQATLHFPVAFWGLYLPMTVTGRVSDIWRSYIVQRLLKELAQPTHVLYSPPMVSQFRNDHDYMADFNAEQHLFARTEALLEFLDQWNPALDHGVDDNLQSRIEALWIELYERQYVEVADVEAIQNWLSALEQGAYVFPAVKDHSRDFDVSTGGIAARQECARQQLENWKEPTPTFMEGWNNGILKLEQPNADLPAKSVARILAEYEVDHPFPHSVDLLCRAGGSHSPHEMAVLIESVQLFWPKCAGRIVLILDRGDEEFVHENIPDWIEVFYSEFPPGMPGRMGNQLFNMYSEQASTSEYVATIDSDTGLVTYLTPDLIFNLKEKDEMGRYPQIAFADTSFQKGMWTRGDNWMLRGDSEDWNFMITLPIVFPRAMFPQYRAGVEAIHNNTLETTDLWEHFRVTERGGWMSMSQFCLLGNWLVRHWKDGPIDLRKERDAPAIRYGTHFPYHPGMSWAPGGKKDPASFVKNARRKVAEGVCELFCTRAGLVTSEDANAPVAKLAECPKLCTYEVGQPRMDYFRYSQIKMGTQEQKVAVVEDHFQPLSKALGSLVKTNQYPLKKSAEEIQ